LLLIGLLCLVTGNHKPKLPGKTGLAPKPLPSWKEQPKKEDHPEFEVFLQKIHDLRVRGMIAEMIAYNWIARRIKPLQKRENPGYNYQGAADPSRMLPAELTYAGIMYQMRCFLTPTTDHPPVFETYSRTNPPTGVGPSSYCCDFFMKTCI
jgi:hypothetical protein